jgi:hypothetical protein
LPTIITNNALLSRRLHIRLLCYGEFCFQSVSSQSARPELTPGFLCRVPMRWVVEPEAFHFGSISMIANV